MLSLKHTKSLFLYLRNSKFEIGLKIKLLGERMGKGGRREK
jgi:hypothetical protein